MQFIFLFFLLFFHSLSHSYCNLDFLFIMKVPQLLLDSSHFLKNKFSGFWKQLTLGGDEVLANVVTGVSYRSVSVLSLLPLLFMMFQVAPLEVGCEVSVI